MSNRTDAWLPLYVADYRADTTRFSTEQHGAYLLIIMDYWRSGAPPDDDAVLAQITGLPLAKWKKHRATIAAKFKIADGVWKHKRIEAELEKARGKQAALSERGKQGAEARWNKDGSGNASGISHEGCKGDATGMQEALPGGVLADAPSHSPTPFTPTASPTPPSPAPEEHPARAPRGSRASPKRPLPNDFSISERVRNWAAEKGFARLDEHLEHFVGKARARAYTYADWDEGFMGAVRDDWAGLRNGRGAAGGHDAAFAEAERRIFGATERDITDEAG